MSRGRDLAEALLETLPEVTPAGLFNPWRDTCQHERARDGAGGRIERLGKHLDCVPCLVLVGEAGGYQGMRYSGVAFTSERLLTEGAIPRIDPSPRITTRPRPFSEPSATIVWSTLYGLRIESATILWNALMLHPFKPGKELSNRTPTDAERALGMPALQLLRESFPDARFVAVGKQAESQMADAGISGPCIRHPANGGATLFATQLAALVTAN